MALLNSEHDQHPLAAPTFHDARDEEPLEPPPYESVVMGQATDATAATADASGSSLMDDGHIPSGTYGSPTNDSFRIQVIDPVRQGEGVSAFISYKVVSDVRAEGYRPGQHEVIRRFRDFTWLRNRLRSQYRGVIVPALPEKNVLQKYKMTADFVEQRRAALGVFLNRVAAHPILSSSPDLRLFLQADETEFAVESSRTLTNGDDAAPAATTGAAVAARKTLSGAAKLFRSLGQSAVSLGSGAVSSSTILPPSAASTYGGVGGSSSSSSRQRLDQEESASYVQIREYFSGLEGHLSEVHRQAEQLVKQQSSLASALVEFGAAMGALGRHQEGNAAGAGTVIGALDQLKTQADAVSVVCRRSSEDLARQFEAPLKEFVRSVRAAKKAMADRGDALAARQAARIELDARRSKLSRLRATPGTKEERIAEAERDLQLAQRASELASSTYDALCQRMDPDLARFQRDRVEEMGYVLRDFAQAQGHAAAETAALWQKMAEVTTVAGGAGAGGGGGGHSNGNGNGHV